MSCQAAAIMTTLLQLNCYIRREGITVAQPQPLRAAFLGMRMMHPSEHAPGFAYVRAGRRTDCTS